MVRGTAVASVSVVTGDGGERQPRSSSVAVVPLRARQSDDRRIVSAQHWGAVGLRANGGFAGESLHGVVQRARRARLRQEAAAGYAALGELVMLAAAHI